MTRGQNSKNNKPPQNELPHSLYINSPIDRPPLGDISIECPSTYRQTVRPYQ